MDHSLNILLAVKYYESSISKHLLLLLRIPIKLSKLSNLFFVDFFRDPYLFFEVSEVRMETLQARAHSEQRTYAASFTVFLLLQEDFAFLAERLEVTS